MGTKANKLLRDDWQTPPELVEAILAGFFPGRRIGIDVAASPRNALAPAYLTKEHDALRYDWQALADAWGVPADAPIWCNPPYSEKKRWIHHALSMRGISEYSRGLIGAPASPYMTSGDYGAPHRPAWRPILLLLPASTSEIWMDRLHAPGVTNVFLTPRVTFQLPDIIGPGNMGGSMLSIVEGLPEPGQRGDAMPKNSWGRWRWRAARKAE